MNVTELSKEQWTKKSLKGPSENKWTRVRNHAPSNINTKRCWLCTSAKYEIVFYKEERFLNKRNQLVGTYKNMVKSKYVDFDPKS